VVDVRGVRADTVSILLERISVQLNERYAMRQNSLDCVNDRKLDLQLRRSRLEEVGCAEFAGSKRNALDVQKPDEATRAPIARHSIEKLMDVSVLADVSECRRDEHAFRTILPRHARMPCGHGLGAYDGTQDAATARGLSDKYGSTHMCRRSGNSSMCG
jgi:hypothetical protein